MSTKKIAIGTKPLQKPVEVGADAWVETRKTPDLPKEEMKRLTIDVPESLHRAIKAQCAMRGTKIADEVREMLMQKYDIQ